MPLFNLIFLGLGWPWVVGEFDGFIKIVICFPTQQWLVYRRHPKKVWASQRLLLRFARCRLVEYGWGGRIESVGHKVIIAVDISLLLLLLYLAMRVVLAYPCRMVCYHTITPPPPGRCFHARLLDNQEGANSANTERQLFGGKKEGLGRSVSNADVFGTGTIIPIVRDIEL